MPTEPTTYDQLSKAMAAAGAQLTERHTAGAAAELVDQVLADAGELASDVLDELLFEHLNTVVAAGCLLDEADQGSYDTTRAVAGTLADEVRRQGRTAHVVRELALEQLFAEAHLAQQARASRSEAEDAH